MIRSGAMVAGKTAVLVFVAALLLALAPSESRAVGLEAGMAAPDSTVQIDEANFSWASPEKFDDALRSAFESPVSRATPAAGNLDSIPGEGGELFDEAALEESTCGKALCLVADLPR